MKLLNPAGLWLLLGIPVLIIIYLIKNQHEDKAVSSTYIWKLSSKFAKKRLPIQKLRKILLFILQLVTIISCAFIASKPSVVGGERYDYVVVIDCSASMTQKDEDGVSRFERAIEYTNELCEGIKKGHTVSVIIANDQPHVLIQNSCEPSEVKTALTQVLCSYGGCDDKKAMELAKEVCEFTKNPKVMFYTDKNYERVGNVTVIPIENQLWNVAVEGLEVQKEGNNTYFTAKVTSVNKSVETAIGLKLDGKLVDAKMIMCEDGKSTEVTFSIENKVNYTRAEIYTESDDGLPEDNSYSYCKGDIQKYDVLLVSNSPLYLETLFTSMGNCNLEFATSASEIVSGMDLYVYDGIYPENYPTDGSVIVFGAGKLPSGLTAGIKYDTAGALNPNTKATVDICKSLEFRGTVLSHFTGLIGNNSWTPLLTCNGATVLSTSKLKNGTHFSVFSFDIHDSNLPLKADFLIMMKNLTEYSLPSMLSKNDYTVGESIDISILPFTTNLYIQYPDGTARELYSDGDSYSLLVDRVGVYTVAAKTEKGGVYSDVFVHLPEGESTTVTADEIAVMISGENHEIEDIYSPIWFYVALAVLLILFIEWGVYYREQY